MQCCLFVHFWSNIHLLFSNTHKVHEKEHNWWIIAHMQYMQISSIRSQQQICLFIWINLRNVCGVLDLRETTRCSIQELQSRVRGWVRETQALLNCPFRYWYAPQVGASHPIWLTPDFATDFYSSERQLKQWRTWWSNLTSNRAWGAGGQRVSKFFDR